MAELLEHCRNHLVAQGIVRPATVAAPPDDPTRPPLWLDPRDGLPAPADEGGQAIDANTDLIIALFPDTGEPTRPFEGFMTADFVEVRYRGLKTPRIFAVERAIAAEFDDKRGWVMDGLWLHESRRFAKLGRVGSDRQGFVYRSIYRFERRTSSGT